MPRYLFLDIICFSKLTVFARFSEQIMSAGKYSSICSRQMKAIVYIFLLSLFLSLWKDNYKFVRLENEEQLVIKSKQLHQKLLLVIFAILPSSSLCEIYKNSVWRILSSQKGYCSKAVVWLNMIRKKRLPRPNSLKGRLVNLCFVFNMGQGGSLYQGL